MMELGGTVSTKCEVNFGAEVSFAGTMLTVYAGPHMFPVDGG
jgi:hypothetical protein